MKFNNFIYTYKHSSGKTQNHFRKFFCVLSKQFSSSLGSHFPIFIIQDQFCLGLNICEITQVIFFYVSQLAGRVFQCPISVQNTLNDSSLLFFFLSFFFVFLGPHPWHKARGRIRAIAASLGHNHSNTRSKPCLRPIPQLTAMLGP